MALVTYNQLRNLLDADWDFDRRVRNHHGRSWNGHSSFPVRMDLVKEGDSFKIYAELPGMEKDKIKLMVENDTLTISGERTRNDEDKREFVRSERFYGTFTRSFSLPENIDKSGISADYKNGLLEVTLPLKEEEKPKQIDVKIS